MLKLPGEVREETLEIIDVVKKYITEKSVKDRSAFRVSLGELNITISGQIKMKVTQDINRGNCLGKILPLI